MIESRPALARLSKPALRSLAPMIVLASAADVPAARRAPVVLGQHRGLRGGPVLGGACDASWLDKARQDAEACLPPALAQAPQGGPCASPLREIPLGGFSAQVAQAGDAYTVTLTVQTPFKPYLVQTPSGQASNIRVSSIKFGVDEMLIGGTVNGSIFSELNENGGYRIGYNKFLWPGQTIVIAGTALAAQANGVAFNVFGFTTA